MLLIALFAQGMLAAHACVEPDAGAVQALSKSADIEVMPCHQAEMSDANECLMHCTQPYQVNLDSHTMAAAPVATVVLLLAMPQIQHQAYAAACGSEPLNTGPPLSIRYCSFLI